MGVIIATRQQALIEQCRARGWTLAFTAAEFRLPVDDVRAVWALMDEAIAEDTPAVLGAPAPRWRHVQPCGTRAAYTRHLQHGEQPCAPCRRARKQAAS